MGLVEVINDADQVTRIPFDDWVTPGPTVRDIAELIDGTLGSGDFGLVVEGVVELRNGLDVPRTLTFCTSKHYATLLTAKRCIAIVDEGFDRFVPQLSTGVTLIYHDAPRLAMAEVLGTYFVEDIENSSYVIRHPSVEIGDGCTIGGRGFGWVRRDDDAQWVRMPHVGVVLLRAGVTIAQNTNVDRGCLGATVLGEGVHVDSQVHIAHGCVVGRRSIICAGATLAGSVTIGENVWIGPGATIRNGLRIGTGALVGVGANVVKDVAPFTTVAGNPAREMR